MTDTRRKFDLDSFAMKLTGGNRMVTFALLLGLGVFMFFWPNTAIKLVVRVAGAVFVVLGAQYVSGWYRGGQRGYRNTALMGAALVAAGLFMLLTPGTIVKVLNLAAAVFLLVHGIATFNTALAQKQTNPRGWLMAAVIAGATVLLGLFCLFGHAATDIIVRVVGVALIVNGVTQFLAAR